MTTTLDENKADTVSDSIEVNVPIQDAYNQWTQFESFPEFMDGVNEIKQLDDTHMHWNVSIGGVKKEFDAEVTEQLPDNRIAWRSTSGEQNAGVVNFHKIDDHTTRILLELDWQPEGFVEKAGNLIGADDRQVSHDLKKFKELIESNGFANGGWRGKVDRDS